ncbi:hypothetical protein V1264_017047 [Littorina saxatilis]|uniref:EGF-like domain-containing protein n=1 Tax=Littorina saxatilis TaxID=31220 RepID=A0AAN9BIC2_9CAEN
MGPGGVVLAVLCVHLAAAQNRYNFLSNGYGAQQHQGYQEQCGKGFRPNDIGGCIDEDECRHPIIQCGVNSDCFNTAGSFVCVCRPGYDKNEHHICVDKDECQDDYKGDKRNFCSVNEDCLNEVGKYACYCKAGFVRDHEVGCRKIGSRLNKHKPNVHGLLFCLMCV